MALTDKVLQGIIRKLIKGQDYRIEVVTLIDAEFLQYVVDFFSKVVKAKLRNRNVTVDWYKRELLKNSLPKEDLAIHSGLNMKTVQNMYNTATKEVVLDAATKHYEELYRTINGLIESGADINVKLTIRIRDVSVDLDLNESLIVINTLAVKRSALRGGLWSTAGKRVQKPLIITLCKLFNVPEKHFDQSQLPPSVRETDFYLFATPTKTYKCEVKLMGKGNPESADAAFARNSDVFIADKLSATNKRQLSHGQIEWVELRAHNGYKRFLTVLDTLGVPASDFTGNLESRLNEIFLEIFPL